MSRIHNFSAGPAVLPEPVVRECQEALWNLNGSGIGVMECSHRTPLFQDIVDRATDRFTRLLGLDPDQKVLFLHGGASTQFYMLPANLLRGGRATYLNTGTWSTKAITEAKRYGTVDVPFSSAETSFDRVPAPGSWGPLPADTRYLHYTSNNTIAGTAYRAIPDVGEVPLACDASSNILSEVQDGSRFDYLYAGAQKNLGPSGMAVLILREGLLERCDPDLPKMVRLQTHVTGGSMFNTPNTYAIFVIERVLAWLEAQGGPEAIGQRNQARADRLYGIIDGSGFWRGIAQPDSRSLMNITFTTGDPELDTRFVREATDAGLSGLKGHRSVGGLRASIYNAQTDAAIDALCVFLEEFERTRG